MAYKRAYEEMFMDGTIRIVAEIGIENTRTKDVAARAGFSEATMYRSFPSKEILLRNTFIYVNKQIFDIVLQSDFFRKSGIPFEKGFSDAWRGVYRYLIEHKQETTFLIRYRYSSYYTDEIKALQEELFNDVFEKVCGSLKKGNGNELSVSRENLFGIIKGMTLCFAENVITGKQKDDPTVEHGAWQAVSTLMNTWTDPQLNRPEYR